MSVEADSAPDHEALDAPTQLPAELALPCQTCMVQGVFTLHDANPEENTVLYRCSGCGRRALVEL